MIVTFVPAAIVEAILVAWIVPVPVGPNEAPEPTSIAAVVLVEPVKAEKARLLVAAAAIL